MKKSARHTTAKRPALKQPPPTSNEPLTMKYRPQTLADIVGQPDAVEQLQMWLRDPYPTAFLFEGETGVGKSATALCLAAELGVDVEAGEFGGLHQIASGEQTGETVRSIMAGMRSRPWSGSGWRALVVNEADAMTAGAAFIWLDALECLPAQTLVMFTTNEPARIPARLRDRCERIRFESGWIMLAPYLQEFVDRIWKAETGKGNAPDASDFGPVADDQGNVSIRRMLQMMQPWVRAGKRPPSLNARELHWLAECRDAWAVEPGEEAAVRQMRKAAGLRANQKVTYRLWRVHPDAGVGKGDKIVSPPGASEPVLVREVTA